MKIAILGAGFTGLATALKLAEAGHKVTIFEREEQVGGLATGFTRPGWEWTLEKAYHHWFTNDSYALSLAKKLRQEVITRRPRTDVLVEGHMIPFDSPLTILAFPYLPPTDRIRTGLAGLYLKLTNNFQAMEETPALPWIRRFMGKRSARIIWEPLFLGKFGEYKDEILLSWFWARIKKRTARLAYPAGGFQSFAEKIARAVEEKSGQILLKTTISELTTNGNGCIISYNHHHKKFDRVISTLPTPILEKLAHHLPKEYIGNLLKTPHLHALNLVLILKQPFLKNTYWLNITDTAFPFLVLSEHTNFMDPVHYNGEHVLYIGNYLPPDHPYLKMSKKKLLKEFDPYLRKINPNYKLSIIHSELFISLFAQPVVTRGYREHIPDFHSPIPHLFIANMDMVYPWDRGTNYAIELGEKIADIINDET